MRTLFFSFPRLNVSVTVPEEVAPDFLSAFSNSMIIDRLSTLHHAYQVKFNGKDLSLYKEGNFRGMFTSTFQLIWTLEQDIAFSLTKSIRDWVAFHAGCVVIKEFACMILGNPDTGKTTTTFNLVEMGNSFLCEEVSPVNPETIMVHPFPLALSMSARYTEGFQSLFRVKEGVLTFVNSEVAKYKPYRVRKEPVPLKMMLIPDYNPSYSPEIIRLSPAEFLTELLQYCFPPNSGEEQFFDSVISIAEKCHIFRLRTNGIKESRRLLSEVSEGAYFPF